jgi:DNA-binding MarR family transcriptional regulator
MKKDIGLLLKNITDCLKKQADASSKASGITFSQLQVLEYIANSDNKRTTQKEIESFLNVSHPTVSGIIKRLEEKDLVKTEVFVKHGIKKSVELSPKGDILENQVHFQKGKIEKLLTMNFNEEEKEKLVYLLEKVQKNITLNLSKKTY